MQYDVNKKIQKNLIKITQISPEVTVGKPCLTKRERNIQMCTI